MLDQSLDDVDFGRVEERFVVDAKWRSRMVSLRKLEQEIGVLSFPAELHASDQFGKVGGNESARARGNGARLE